jgi:transcription termination/antitermination protein NusG
MDPALRWIIRSTKYFVRLLPTTGDPKPIQEKDRRILAHFMSFGKVADTSKVVFDENERIVVIEGPLKGLEGSIIKINKRKGRAKVSLDMCESSFLIDLSFEILDRSAKGSGSENGQQP